MEKYLQLIYRLRHFDYNFVFVHFYVSIMKNHGRLFLSRRVHYALYIMPCQEIIKVRE